MPRKTDGILFELHPGPMKDQDGQPLLYVRPAKGYKKSMNELENYCETYHYIPQGEVRRVLDVVQKTVGKWLSKGYRVDTPFGSFAPRLKMLGEHTDPKTVSGRDVVFAGISYNPSKEFVRNANKNYEGYRKSMQPVGNSQMYDPMAMNEALRKSMALGFTTIADFMQHSGLKRDSAKLYLDSLCEGAAPSLRKVKRGRLWHYLPS